jgi:hypothetical protein
MPASNVFLIRKNRQWAQFTQIENVTLTGAIASYSSVTGNSSTNVITLTGAAIPSGTPFYFQSKDGGSGITLNTIYWAVNVSGSTLKASLTPGGSAVALGSTINSAVIIATADEMNVWSSEFRDIFNDTGAPWSAYKSGIPVTSSAVTTSIAVDVEGQAGISVVPNSLVPSELGYNNLTPTEIVVAGSSLTVSGSDEKLHAPLRQTLLKRTHWKFDRGSTATPRYLYATWADGDIVANNPPETSA